MNKINRVTVKVMFVAATMVGVLNIADYIYASIAVSADSGSLSMSATIEDSVTMELSGSSFTLSPAPTSSGTFATTAALDNPFKVSVHTNSSLGFSISMTTSSTDLTSGSDTISTLTSSVTPDNFQSDKWGYSIGNSSASYNPVLLSNDIGTYTYANSSTGAEVQVNFGVKLSLATPPGTYTNTLNFTTTAVAPPQT